MGISFSCPFASDNDVESGLQSIIVRSISLGDKEMKTPERSVSFKGDSESKSESQGMIIKKSLDSGKMIVEGSISLNQREMGTLISVVSPCLSQSKLEEETGICMEKRSHQATPQSPKHEAAVKLQKVYKSFRTRRKLADCAVLVEQRWWKLLDFAELKHSSISFFDIEHHETAISRWSRAKTRAAKVGKGLSKNGKARKLALQHWLEAIDPRHRYGHNLHFYYAKWLESQSREPFFYWLDIGEGKELNLEKCPRSKLQQQCIKYLGPMERKAYEVTFEEGKFFYKQSGELLDTSSEPHAKWIFVLSTSKALYVGKKKKGTFQHSSFLAGGATSAAGRLVVENGILKAVWPHSGHYRPTPENFQEFVSFLIEKNVDLTDVKMDPVDEDERKLAKQRSSLHLRNNSEEEEVVLRNVEGEEEGTVESIAEDQKQDAPEHETAVLQDNAGSSFSRKLSHLQIPSRDDLLATMQSENPTSDPTVADHDINVNDDDDGYDSSTEEPSLSEEDDEQVEKEGGFDEEEHDQGEIIPAETILKRINSHKEAKSYQLGKQLSCKWTTGAGPRIGCVRDYPSELQFRALEQVNLSPRSALRCQMKLLLAHAPNGGSGQASTPTPNCLVSHLSLTPGQYRLQSSPLSIQRKPTL